MAHKLGPLNGRTLRGPSPAAASSSSPGSGTKPTTTPIQGHGGLPSSSPGPTSPLPSRTGSPKYNGATTATTSPFSASPSSSSLRIKLNSPEGPLPQGKRHPSVVQEEHENLTGGDILPFLLPREQETTYHRQLRTSLVEFCRNRSNWEAEVYDLAEIVGRYASCLGEIEDELKQRSEEGSRNGSGRVHRRSRRPMLDSAMWFKAQQVSDGALCNFLHELEEHYAKLERGRKRVIKVSQAVVKVKDEVRDLERDWIFKEPTGVAWSERIDGSELVQALTTLVLQVQLQTTELLASLRTLYTQCSPLGFLALFAQEVVDAEGNVDGKQPRGQSPPVYDVTTASKLRSDVLVSWRDLPHIERTGLASFEWWQEVWRCEVGRWDEFASPPSASVGPR